MGWEGRPGRVSSFPHLPPHAHTHPDLPTASRSIEKQPSGKGAEGGRAAWNLAIFDKNTLGAAKGRGLSLTLPCCPGPGLVLNLQGDPRTPPGCGSTLPHPLSRPLSSPLNLCTAFAVAGFLPSQGCRPLLGLNSPPPSPKHILARSCRCVGWCRVSPSLWGLAQPRSRIAT